MNRITVLAVALALALSANLVDSSSAQDAPDPGPTIMLGEPPAEDPHGQPLYGTRGNPWTFVMQAWLGANGFWPGPVDGWFGKGTRMAVSRFQRAVGIQPNGEWTWETAVASQSYVPPQPPRPVLGGACSQWADLALAAGFTVQQWPTVSRLMWRESNCQPGARNPSGASGLMQIMPMWADDCGGSRADLFDPAFNLRCAHHVWRVQGWPAWSTY